MQVQNAMMLDPRVEFHRVVIKSSPLSSAGPGVGLKAYSTGGQRSSRATSLCKANGLVILPPLSRDKKCLNAGELAQALVIGEIAMEEF
jgi:gephyrin